MIEYSLPSKLLHVAMIILIAIYVVFVDNKRSTVESVSEPIKPDHAPHANNCSHQKGYPS